ncbi:MAG: glycosyltransferase family 39 protein, partial [Gemmataceae bacterium]|nr:glycosyltransferase family 39 protein [Gemmataceae bacterium]
MANPENNTDLPETPPAWSLVIAPTLLAMVLWATFVLKLQNLDHTALTRWDEAFHAVVAQNVFKHPLKPTLVDAPFLPYDGADWNESHVWLHKPILPFWQVALSFALLGVNTMALRLPAVILSTAAAWLTYLIGKELLDRRAALIAAALQAANPFLMKLVHGYQFADTVDISLLFWVEAGVYFLTRAVRTGHWRDVLLAGVAQGFAFLSKSYLAGIILGIALTAWLLPVFHLAKRDDCRIGPVRILGLLGATLATVAPWAAYCMVNFPDEFWHEHALVWRHLHANVEGWAAPWDRLIFDYLIGMYGFFYTPVLVAVVALIGKAVVERHRGLWLVYAWGLGVVLVHLVATTKTPSGAVIAMPALLLLVGCLISEALRGDPWSSAALTGVLAMSLYMPAVIRNPGYGYPSSRGFGVIMFGSTWVLYHVGCALSIAAVTWLINCLRTLQGWGIAGRVVRVLALVFC